MKRIGAILVMMAAVLSACSRETPDEGFISDSCIKLCVQGEEILRYDENNYQLLYNADGNRFALVADDSSVFFDLVLEKAPETVGETIKGSVIWATESSYESKKNITFNVSKVEGHIIWLWCPESGTGIVTCRLE